MNKKIMATAMALLLSVSLVGLAVSGDTTADTLPDSPVNIGSFHMDSGNTETVTLILNDTAYGSNYTITWSAGTVTAGSSNVTFSNEVSGNANEFKGGDIMTDDATLNITRTSPGHYTLTISNVSTTVNVAIKAQITVSVDGSPLPLDPVYYTLTINDKSTMGKLASTDAKTFTYGVNVESTEGTLSFNSSSDGSLCPAKLDDYTWYAIGLPAGLAMSSAGVISGVPLETTDEAVQVKLVARDAQGKEYAGTVSVTVEKTNTPTGVVLKVEGPKTGVTQVGSTDAYIVQQGTSPTFTVTASGGYGNVVYTIIDSNGNRSAAETVNMSAGSGTFTASTDDGTGAYVVEVTYSGITKSVTLHVMSKPSTVVAEIVVSGVS